MKYIFTIKQRLFDHFKLILQPVIAIMLVFLVSNPASSQVNIIMNVTPGTVEVNQTFTVEVAIDFTSAGSVSAVDVFLNFDPLDLEVVAPFPTTSAAANTGLNNVSIGDAFPNDNNPLYDNTLGHVDHGRFRSSVGGHPNSDFSFYCYF